MKRLLLLTAILPFLIVACSETSGLDTNPAAEEDYAIEIASNAEPESGAKIINGTKVEAGLEVQDDLDGDLIPDEKDNCPTVSNPYQEDSNDNAVGDACENLD